jgi:hypothetical protein
MRREMPDLAANVELKYLQHTLQSFCRDRVLRLKEIYHWDEPDSVLPRTVKFNPPIDVSSADWNIALKWALHEAFLKADETERRSIAEWVVKQWGGVKNNKPETFDVYLAMLQRRPVAQTPWQGVASYSKILAVYDPKQYAIFDARVASALNAVQMLDEGNLTVRFPIPNGQNEAIKRFAAQIGETDASLEIEKAQAYAEYLRLIKAVSDTLGCELYTIEMLLFSLATRLARKLAPATAPALPLPRESNRKRLTPKSGRSILKRDILRRHK